jgi:Fic family protein
MEDIEEVKNILLDILKWVKFAGLDNASKVIRRVLDTKQKRLIYNLSDGENTSQEIAKISGVSDYTVRNYWKSWNTHGIVDPLSVRGGTRYKKTFELEQFGLMTPEITEENKDEH